VAKEIASPFAAENLIVTDCPGIIRAGEPVPWKVPDSTNGWDFNTLETVIVSLWVGGVLPFLQAANGTKATSAQIAFFM
jgi:hypothetical protein